MKRIDVVHFGGLCRAPLLIVTVHRALPAIPAGSRWLTLGIADGAYDGAPTRDLLVERFGEIVEVIIPPPKTAVQSPQSVETPPVRDRHIAGIQIKGRMAWQKSSVYNQRSRVETQMGRWKAVIGQKLKARHFDNQRTEAKIGVSVLNWMTELGHPQFERVA